MKFYIAIDGIGWCQDADFFKAISRREEDSGKCLNMYVYEVEGDIEAPFRIEWFVPQIEGSRCVFVRGVDRETKEIEYKFS